jgi:hypothetical protein
MIDITVLAMIDVDPKPGTPLVKLMNERLSGLASDLKGYLQKEFALERECEDLIIYMSYNSKYAIRWKIVNDVPDRIQQEVAKRCGNLGYILWKELDLYGFKAKH